MVVTILRSHRDDDKGLTIMSRHRYPIEACRVFEKTTPVKLQEVLNSLEKADNKEPTELKKDLIDPSTNLKGKHGNRKNEKSSDSNKTVNDGGRAKQATLKIFLGEALGYGPALSEHIILDVGLVPNTKMGFVCKVDSDTIAVLAKAVGKFEDWLVAVISGEKISEGYILMQNRASGKKERLPPQEGSLNQIYDEFCPILLNQFKSRDFISLETFDAALDEFYCYSKIESQRSEQQQKVKEGSAIQKLNKIRADQNGSCLIWRGEDYVTNPLAKEIHLHKRIQLYSAMFHRLEDRSVASPIQSTTSLTSREFGTAPDNSSSGTYFSVPRPAPYDVDQRLSRMQRNGLVFRREKSMNNFQEESQPLRRSLSSSGIEPLAAGKKWNRVDSEEYKTAGSESSEKFLSTKATHGFIYSLPPPEDEDVCPTCLEEYTPENPKIITRCSHHFHLGCIYEWMERSETCPLCGKEMEFCESP